MAEENRKRKRYFKVHLYDDELAILDAKADEVGLSKSEYIRNLIVFGSTIKPTNFSDEYAHSLLVQMSRIGNNLNQIAMRVNAANGFNGNELDDVRQLFYLLYNVMEDLVSE